MSESNVQQRRFKRAQIYQGTAHGPRLKPGKLAARESAHLRATGGVQVTRAAVRRLMMRTVKDTVPIVSAENEAMARRLGARGKHVPANLTVIPAHQWIITDDAWTKATACFDSEASLLADVAWMLADYAGKKSVKSGDFYMASKLIEKLAK